MLGNGSEILWNNSCSFILGNNSQMLGNGSEILGYNSGSLILGNNSQMLGNGSEIFESSERCNSRLCGLASVARCNSRLCGLASVVKRWSRIYVNPATYKNEFLKILIYETKKLIHCHSSGKVLNKRSSDRPLPLPSTAPFRIRTSSGWRLGPRGSGFFGAYPN